MSAIRELLIDQLESYHKAKARAAGKVFTPCPSCWDAASEEQLIYHLSIAAHKGVDYLQKLAELGEESMAKYLKQPT